MCEMRDPSQYLLDAEMTAAMPHTYIWMDFMSVPQVRIGERTPLLPPLHARLLLLLYTLLHTPTSPRPFAHAG